MTLYIYIYIYIYKLIFFRWKKNASYIPTTYRLNVEHDCLDFFETLNSEIHET